MLQKCRDVYRLTWSLLLITIIDHIHHIHRIDSHLMRNRPDLIYPTPLVPSASPVSPSRKLYGNVRYVTGEFATRKVKKRNGKCASFVDATKCIKRTDSLSSKAYAVRGSCASLSFKLFMSRNVPVSLSGF